MWFYFPLFFFLFVQNNFLLQNKKKMKEALSLLWMLAMASCSKPVDSPSFPYSEFPVGMGSYTLSTYHSAPEKNSKYLVVFDTGLGDYSKVWTESRVPDSIIKNADVVLYDRAGYNRSTAAPAPRDVDRMRKDLDSVINYYAKGRKLILVAHSLGGYIIRDYAVKNPSKVAALLFVDPSHEQYNGSLNQAGEDQIYNAFKAAYGVNFGGTMEARELIEDAQYMSALPSLPDVPVVVISSMKVDAAHTAADRQLWYNAHEALKAGVTDFTHISTTLSGHYIMNTEPALIKDRIRILLSKLP